MVQPIGEEHCPLLFFSILGQGILKNCHVLGGRIWQRHWSLCGANIQLDSVILHFRALPFL